MNNESKLLITTKEWYLLTVRCVIFSVLSLGILIPYEYYIFTKTVTEHTLIDGQSLVFKGKVRSVYIIMVTAVCAMILVSSIMPVIRRQLTEWTGVKAYEVILALINTIVIALLLNARLAHWKQGCIHFTNEDGDSRLRPNLIRCAEIGIICFLIKYVTAFIGYPFSHYLQVDYMVNRKQIDSERLLFTGKRKDLIILYFKHIFIVILTLGIYYPIWSLRLYSWEAESTHLDKSDGYVGRKDTRLEKFAAKKVSDKRIGKYIID